MKVKVFQNLILSAVLTIACSCNTTNYVATVNSYGSVSPESRTYWLGVPNRANSLEAREFAGLVSKGLMLKGYTQANSRKQADLQIEFDYAISDPRHYSYTGSRLDYVPGETATINSNSNTSGYYSGTSNAYGSASAFGSGGYGYSSGSAYGSSSGNIYGNTTRTTTVTSPGRLVSTPVIRSGVEYTRKLLVRAIQSGGSEAWNTTVTSKGSSGELRAVFPYLVAASYPYYGTSTGKPITVSVGGASKQAKPFIQ